MSYYLREDSRIVFGNAGISEDMKRRGYVRTMCTSAVTPNRHGEQWCDIHMTKEQMHYMATQLIKELERMEEDARLGFN